MKGLRNEEQADECGGQPGCRYDPDRSLQDEHIGQAPYDQWSAGAASITDESPHPEEFAPVNAAFILVSSADQENFYLHSLMWLVQLEEIIDFKSKWMEAKSKEEIRQIILESWNLIVSGEIDAKSIEIGEPEPETKKEKKEKREDDGKKKS